MFSENRAINGIVWKNYGRVGQVTVRGIHFACWVTKVTVTLRVWSTYRFYFYGNDGHENAPLCILPVLFYFLKEFQKLSPCTELTGWTS